MEPLIFIRFSSVFVFEEDNNAGRQFCALLGNKTMEQRSYAARRQLPGRPLVAPLFPRPEPAVAFSVPFHLWLIR